MSLTDVEADEATSGLTEAPGSSMVTVVVTTAMKAVLAALAGMVLLCGLGLLVWSATPSSGSGPLPLLRAGIAAFCSANGMTLTIGRSGLTLPPLMLTLVAAALLTTVSGRGRVVAKGRDQEAAAVITSAVVWAVVVAGVGVGFGGGSVSPAQWWRPALLALVVVGIATLIRGDGWRRCLFDRVPAWVPVSIRCGGAAMAALLGGGAVTLLIGLIRTFGDSVTVQTLAAPGAAGGLGMTLLGIAYLPNAVVAATGYSTGIGFTIGSGTYTPFGSSPVELPAVSLLTAVPDGHAFARPTLLLLLSPLLAAVLIGRGVVRRLDSRNDRLFAAGGAALFAAVLSAVIAEVAAGGVTGGEWSSTGVPPLLFGFAVLAGLGVVSTAVVLLVKVPAGASVAVAGDAAEDDAEPESAAEPEAATDDSDVQAHDETVGESPDAVEAVEVVELDAAGGTGSTAGEDVSDHDDERSGHHADASRSGETPDLADIQEPDAQAIAATGVGDTPVGSASETPEVALGVTVAPAIPSPREEDVVAADMTEADREAKLVSGLIRRAKPRRTG